MEAADFALRLHDQVSKPAKSARKSMQDTESAMERLRRASALQDRANRSALRRRMADRRREVAQAERLAIRARRRAGLETVGGQMEIVRHQLAKKKAREAALRAHGVDGGGGMGAGDMLGAAGMGRFAGPAAAIAAVAAAVGLVTMAVVRMGQAFGSALFHAMDFATKSQVALTSILKSGDLAAQQFNQVRREAAQLGLDVFSTVDQFKMLANAGFNVATSRELVRMSADLQALTGSSQSAEFALRAISQIKMKGRLQAEEVTGQLAEHGVSAEAVYAELGKRLGKTRKEILAMQKAGDVSADIAIPAILQAVRNQLGKGRSGEFALEITTSSISGMARQLKGGLQNALISLGQEVAPSATIIARKFFGTIQKIAASPAVARARTRIVEMFQSAAEWVETNWPRIEPMIVRVAEALADGFSTAADFVMNHGEEMRTVLTGVATAGGLLAAQAVVLTGAVYALGAGIFYAVGKITEFVTAAPTAAGWLLSFMHPLAHLVALWKLLGAAIDFVAEKFRSIPAKLQGAILPVSMTSAMAATGAAGAQAGAASSPGLPTGLGAVTTAESRVGSSKSIGNVTIPVSVQALDLDDPAVAGEKLGAAVRRVVMNEFEKLGDG